MVTHLFEYLDWIFETKLDGYRASAVIDATGKARLWSRNQLPLEPKFPTVGDAVEQLNLRSTILDGERNIAVEHVIWHVRSLMLTHRASVAPRPKQPPQAFQMFQDSQKAKNQAAI